MNFEQIKKISETKVFQPLNGLNFYESYRLDEAVGFYSDLKSSGKANKSGFGSWLHDTFSWFFIQQEEAEKESGKSKFSKNTFKD